MKEAKAAARAEKLATKAAAKAEKQRRRNQNLPLQKLTGMR